MDNLYFWGYELLSSLAFHFVLYGILRVKKRENRTLFSYHYLWGMFIFFMYIVGVFHCTGAGTIYDGWRYQFEIRQEQINFIPFSRNIDVTAYFLNILLFIPLGLLAPVVEKKINKLSGIIANGLFLTLLIEMSQLLNNRRTDIDDVILNTLGAVIGFAIFKLFNKITKTEHQVYCSVGVPLPIYIIVIFIGRFLLYNEMGLAKLLYGF